MGKNAVAVLLNDNDLSVLIDYEAFERYKKQRYKSIEGMRMKHSMKLKPEPFEKIRFGTKTIELRLLDEKRKLVKVGDEIEFSNLEKPNERITVRVLAIHKFGAFAELYKALPLEKCGYLRDELPLADPSDMEKYYSKEEQSRS